VALSGPTSLFTPIVVQTSSASQTSASFTPTAGDLIAIAIISRASLNAIPVHTLTNTHAGTWNWTKLCQIDNAAATSPHGFSVWVAIVPSSPGAGTITAGASGPNQTRWRVQGVSWSGAGLPTNYIAEAQTTSLTSSVVLPNTPLSTSHVAAWIGLNLVNPAVAPGTGYTEIFESGDTNATDLEMENKAGSATATATWTVTGSPSFHLKFAMEVPVRTYTLTASNGSLALTGQNANLRKASRLTAANGTLTLTGQPAVLARGLRLLASNGSLALTGQNANLLKANVLVAANGSLALTGQNANLVKASRLATLNGSLALTGQTANLIKAAQLAALNGTLALTGQTANLVKTSRLAAANGSLALTGQTAIVSRGLRLIAANGSLALSGQTANLVKVSRLAAVAGTMNLAGQNATLARGLRLVAANGSMAFTGQTANLRKASRLAAANGSLTLTGQNSNFRKTYVLTASAGILNLSTPDISIRRTYIVQLATGVYALTGQDAVIQTGTRLVAGTGIYVLTGIASGMLVLRQIANVQLVQGGSGAVTFSFILTQSPSLPSGGLLTGASGVKLVEFNPVFKQGGTGVTTEAFTKALTAVLRLGSGGALTYAKLTALSASFLQGMSVVDFTTLMISSYVLSMGLGGGISAAKIATLSATLAQGMKGTESGAKLLPLATPIVSAAMGIRGFSTVPQISLVNQEVKQGLLGTIGGFARTTSLAGITFNHGGYLTGAGEAFVKQLTAALRQGMGSNAELLSGRETVILNQLLGQGLRGRVFMGEVMHIVNRVLLTGADFGPNRIVGTFGPKHFTGNYGPEPFTGHFGSQSLGDD
jgi:hypothetical protein